MKKWILILPALIVLSIAFIFLYIPTTITIAGFKTVNCPSASVARLLEDKSNIKKWWPGTIINDSEAVFQNITYTIVKANSLGITIKTSYKNVKLTGEINPILLKKDTCAVEWQYQPFTSGNNIINRLENYNTARTLKNQLNLILEAVKLFTEHIPNIYGIDIVQTKVKDSSLISTKESFTHYPTNKEIADLISTLKKYIIENNGLEKDFPMLNIRLNEENKYEAMIAIPLLKDIPVNENFIIKKMILGNILEAKVTGGPATIEKGEIAMKNFAKDYGKVSPAIPFQLLVTDRNKEQDTSKWITYLKYPVF